MRTILNYLLMAALVYPLDWYIIALWVFLGAILLFVVAGYLYYILRVEALLRTYKHRDWRYDG